MKGCTLRKWGWLARETRRKAREANFASTILTLASAAHLSGRLRVSGSPWTYSPPVGLDIFNKTHWTSKSLSLHTKQPSETLAPKPLHRRRECDAPPAQVSLCFSWWLYPTFVSGKTGCLVSYISLWAFCWCMSLFQGLGNPATVVRLSIKTTKLKSRFDLVGLCLVGWLLVFLGWHSSVPFLLETSTSCADSL